MFFNRERELEKLLRLVSTEPNLITFVYGPINSGKTALMMEFIKKLPDDHIAFYINLRRTPITSYSDFVDVLFSVEFRNKVKTLKEAVSLVLSAGKETFGFPVPTELLARITKEKKPKNAFAYIVTLMEEVRKAGKRPILILDELQVIGDLKVDGSLIYELFNFFIHLTKESHLSHVFVVTSDSLFIERVYSEAMLQGRAEYFLVDDFKRETALRFLKNNGLSDDEAELVWNYFGGKPVYLAETIKHRDELKEWCERMLKLRTSQILDELYALEKELFEKVVKLFFAFEKQESVPYRSLSEEILWAVKRNILFAEPVDRVLRPQGRLELLAIKRILDIIE
ncbi:ATP-binding protein [Pyrococcus abyssi]|uniref:Uncharacterized ATP-binding protein PYRAB09480 n=1 Tax=Pyrococcus abyssi (strain GE5 / Orsay) TaxID=272844 RepID=Y948_PYRAB|nr:ATP-binding protein [Pyrococcus abyssi]Q9V050.1 RecName: Full=Uncharacterized ATP-binding protein PYRAB09480 [Pyrococcus abyssi GE5]CAB49856.1 Archaeal ATPase [Pyrococcus abyssi GE5]CCE70353.1 TPA: ATP-binding protein [Pyrococcus abyssi GE5]